VNGLELSMSNQKKSESNHNFILTAISILAINILVLSVTSEIIPLNNGTNYYYLWPIQAQAQQLQQDSSNSSSNTIRDANSLPDLFSKVEKSVVQVADDNNRDILSGITLGSGFVYDKNGYIVTNYHVVAGSTTEGNVQVTFLDGTVYNARLIGGDPFSDLAVLKIEGDNIPSDKLIPLPIGDSISLRIGEQIVAIGNPFGLSGSMTEGIISGLGRMIPSSPESPRNPPPADDDILPPPAAEFLSSTYSIPDIIQIDAPINPGNSGGPLLNIKGEVIGINTAIFSTTGASAGIGFAIPSNTIKKVVPSLIATGSYQHPYIGIVGTDITPEIADALGLAEAKGFLVTDVTPGSPAQKAGVQGGISGGGGGGGDNSLTSTGGRGEMNIGGDVILKIDDKTVRKIDDILTYLEREKKVGDTVQFTVLRNGVGTENIKLTLGPRPSSQQQISESLPQPGTLPPQEGTTPPEQQEQQPPLSDDLYNQCVRIAGKDICDFMFRR
jgi:S1-C subfamily serine protease